MKTETKYRLLLAAVLTFTVLFASSALDTIDSFQNTLEDIDEDNAKRIKLNKKNKAPLLNNFPVNKVPAFTPSRNVSCPFNDLDEFHRSIYLKKD